MPLDLSKIPDWLVEHVARTMPPEIRQALQGGAAIISNVSGGLDSDAMSLLLHQLHQQEGWPGPFVLIHAHLSTMEWEQTLPHIRQLAAQIDRPLYVVERSKGDLLDLWWERYRKLLEQGRSETTAPFSDSKNRFCTSTMKREPIDKWIRAFIPEGVAVNCIGLRALESYQRATKPVLALRKQVCTKSRKVFNWHPIFHLEHDDVLRVVGSSTQHLNQIRATVREMRRTTNRDEMTKWIADHFAGHPAYAWGNRRLSCNCCVLASRNDLLNGIEHNPEVFRKIADLEITSGKSFQPGRFLASLRVDLLRPDQRAALAKLVPETAASEKAATTHQMSMF